MSKDTEETQKHPRGPRLFAGVYPGGIVYADRHNEISGDYKRVGFLPYHNLELRLEPDCPEILAAQIREDAAKYKPGDKFQTSTCGSYVILGQA